MITTEKIVELYEESVITFRELIYQLAFEDYPIDEVLALPDRSERLTAQVLGLKNVREATLYPRDRYKVEP